MREIISTMKEAWKKSAKQKGIIVTLIAILIFGCVFVTYSIYHYYIEFKGYENWLRICFGMLVLYSFPIMYTIANTVAEKNRLLKRILAMESGVEKELETFEFYTFFQFLAEVLARLSTIVLIVFINELLTQLPQFGEDINHIATREAYWGFLQIMLYLFLLFAAALIPYSDSFLFSRGSRKWKIKKLLKRQVRTKDVKNVLQN